MIPPAWAEVWIRADPLGHIQVVGTDAAGRRQYLYHPRWQERRGRSKYELALDLAEALPHARARVTQALCEEAMDQQRVLAAAVQLLDISAVRIGSRAALRGGRSRGRGWARTSATSSTPSASTLDALCRSVLELVA